MSQSHRLLHASLTALVMDLAKQLEALKVACREVAAEATALQKRITGARQGLMGAFNDHQEACRAFDVILCERAKGRPVRGPDLDPWTSEGKLVRVSVGQWQGKGVPGCDQEH